MVSQYLLDRVIPGAVATAAVAFAAHKAHTLTKGGAIAAFIVGSICIAAGWSWGFLLVGMFVTASALSKIGESRKAALLGPVVEKGDERDEWQVAANGLIYASAAAAFLLFGDPRSFVIGAGALAASTADTWSTEIGTLGGGVPRLIVSGRKVPAGTSGGLTFAGLLGALAGAAAVAAAARWAEWPVALVAVLAGGLAGALGDSLLGATVQSRRWCERCRSATERPIHSCGARTTHAGGLAWLNNDGVNLVSTMIGGLVALLLSGSGVVR